MLIKCPRKAIFQDLIEMFVMGLSNDSAMALTWKGEKCAWFLIAEAWLLLSSCCRSSSSEKTECVRM